MPTIVELPDFVNPYGVEAAHRRANEEQQKGNWAWGTLGLRAARARDPKVLKVLELASGILNQLEEDQRREHRRTSDVYGETKETTEYQMWREAYATADRGEPCENLMWIYGAAAWLAGIHR